MAVMKITGKATYVEEKNKAGKELKYFLPHCLNDQRVYCSQHTDYVLDTELPVKGTVYDIRLTADVNVTQQGGLFMSCLVAVELN